MEIDILRHQNVKIARRYFWMGFALLPFLWLVNYCYFKNVINEPQCHPLVYRYVMASKWFAIVTILLIISWTITFWVINTDSWGEGWFMYKHDSEQL